LNNQETLSDFWKKMKKKKKRKKENEYEKL